MGEAFSDRVAASLLKGIGLPELITNSNQEYEKWAIEHGNNSEKLNLIRRKLISNIPTEPLFNTEQFTQNLENVYIEAIST